MMTDLTPLWISLKTATIATIFTFFIGIGAARWMTYYQGKSKALIDGLFTLPLVLPPTVVGFFLLLIFGKYSPVGQLLQYFDLSIIFTWTAALIASITVAFPLMYKTAKGAFEQVDPDLIQAARTLGASDRRIFFKIIIPLSWPGIAAGTVLSFARALGEFGATLMLAGNIPGVTQTIPIAIFFAAEGGNMQQALFWVVSIIGISFAMIIALHYWNQVNHTYFCRMNQRGK